MNYLRILTLIAKIAGLLTSLNVIPFLPANYGLWVFLLASILKDATNRIGDLLDDGKPNGSFKGE